MESIRVEGYLLREIQELHWTWTKSLPKTPGQIGTISRPIASGAPIGSTIGIFNLEPEFLELLRAKQYPFEEISA